MVDKPETCIKHESTTSHPSQKIIPPMDSKETTVGGEHCLTCKRRRFFGMRVNNFHHLEKGKTMNHEHYLKLLQRFSEDIKQKPQHFRAGSTSS